MAEDETSIEDNSDFWTNPEWKDPPGKPGYKEVAFTLPREKITSLQKVISAARLFSPISMMVSKARDPKKVPVRFSIEEAGIEEAMESERGQEKIALFIGIAAAFDIDKKLGMAPDSALKVAALTWITEMTLYAGLDLTASDKKQMEDYDRIEDPPLPPDRMSEGQKIRGSLATFFGGFLQPLIEKSIMSQYNPDDPDNGALVKRFFPGFAKAVSYLPPLLIGTLAALGLDQIGVGLFEAGLSPVGMITAATIVAGMEYAATSFANEKKRYDSWKRRHGVEPPQKEREIEPEMEPARAAAKSMDVEELIAEREKSAVNAQVAANLKAAQEENRKREAIGSLKIMVKGSNAWRALTDRENIGHIGVAESSISSANPLEAAAGHLATLFGADNVSRPRIGGVNYVMVPAGVMATPDNLEFLLAIKDNLDPNAAQMIKDAGGDDMQVILEIKQGKYDNLNLGKWQGNTINGVGQLRFSLKNNVSASELAGEGGLTDDGDYRAPVPIEDFLPSINRLRDLLINHLGIKCSEVKSLQNNWGNGIQDYYIDVNPKDILRRPGLEASMEKDDAAKEILAAAKLKLEAEMGTRT